MTGEVPPVEGSQSQEACPLMPHFEMSARRAKALLILEPGSDPRQQWVDCWARIDGPWLLFLDDEESRWASWPLQHIRCVEWQSPVIAALGGSQAKGSE